MDNLFVYGIFLDQHNRDAFGMSNPRYDTVPDYITQGHHIVQAVPVDPEFGTALTGLLVDMDTSRWEGLDALEGGYDRKRVTTTSGHQAWMYVRPTNERE